MQPRDLRDRRSELVRRARESQLATAVAQSRDEERRTHLARLWQQRTAGRPAAGLS